MAFMLALPEPLLLAVLQCLAAAGDQRSLFSAARAHSRLHQAAVLALSSISAVLTQQQHADSVVLYLNKHDHNIDTIDLAGPERAPRVSLRQLPDNLRGLDVLQLDSFSLQLQLGHRGAVPGPDDNPNRIDVKRLNDIDRRLLKESLRAARGLQQRLQLDYQR